MIQLFNSEDEKIQSGGTIYENEKCRLVFEGMKDNEIQKIISRSRLNDFVTWLKGNKTATLKITNYIGKVRILDLEIDVRSKKMLSKLKGVEQLDYLLQDIQTLSRELAYSPYSPSLARREVDWNKISESDLLQFNYYYQLFFNCNKGEDLPSLFERAKRNAALGRKIESLPIKIWQAKKVNGRLIRSLLRQNKSSLPLEDFPSMALTEVLSDRSNGRSISLNETIYDSIGTLSYDVNENQFLKFFFRSIESLCIRVLNNNEVNNGLKSNAEELLFSCRRVLNDPFLREVGELYYINTNSTILKRRSGYKEIYEHFILSKFSASHLFEDFFNDMTIDLKDVATLYEIWVFFKVAKELLNKNVEMTENTVINENGSLCYQTSFEDNIYKVSYNRTFSRANSGSYSVVLRPDVSVEKKDSSELYLFDAKYRNVELNNNGALFRKAKSDDLQKMHTYMDAIDRVKASIVIYPGENISLFERKFPITDHLTIESDLSNFVGVGAIPLVPNEENIEFSNFLKKTI